MNSNKSLAASQTDFNFDYDPEDNYCDFDRVVDCNCRNCLYHLIQMRNDSTLDDFSSDDE
jgi:hypothetical protein